MPRRDPAAFAEFVAARSAALHRAAYLMVGDASSPRTSSRRPSPRRTSRGPGCATRQRRGLHPQGDHHDRDLLVPPQVVAASAPATRIPEAAAAGRADGGRRSARWVWAALQALPPRQRAAIVLRYYEDLTEAQTAAALGCAVGTVKSQVPAGLATLRTTLDSHGGEHLELLPRDLRW